MESQTDILPIRLDKESTLLVQVTTLDKGQGRGGGERKVTGLKDAFSLEGVTTSIEKISNALAKTVDKIQPDKAIIEFGVELATKEGQLTALLVQGSATANLTIKLEWEKKHGDEKK